MISARPNLNGYYSVYKLKEEKFPWILLVSTFVEFTLSTFLFSVRDTLEDWLSILFSMYESVTLVADKKIHNIAVVVGPKRSLIN